jgi:hypothetical protein
MILSRKWELLDGEYVTTTTDLVSHNHAGSPRVIATRRNVEDHPSATDG